MKRVRNALRYILLIVGILITLFAILSGAKRYVQGGTNMIVSRGMHIRNIAYMSPNWKDICIADMNELYDIPPLRRIRKYKNSRIIVNYGG